MTDTPHDSNAWLPNDGRPERDAVDPTAALPDRLQQLEANLRQLRPQRPQLSAEAWQAILRAAAAPSSLSGETVATATDASPPQSVAPPLRPMLASWSCGALVGAAVMFLIMIALEQPRDAAEQFASPTAPPQVAGSAAEAPAETLESHVTGQKALAEIRRPADVLPPRAPAPLRPGEQVLPASLTDPWSSGTASLPLGGPTLRAGMLLHRHDALWATPPDRTAALVGNGHRPPAASRPLPNTNHDLEPFRSSPESTHQQLLAELLDEGA